MWRSYSHKLGKKAEEFRISYSSYLNTKYIGYLSKKKKKIYKSIWSHTLYNTARWHSFLVILYNYSKKKTFLDTASIRTKHSTCSFSTSESAGTKRCFHNTTLLPCHDCCSANLHLGPDQAQHPRKVWDRKKHRKPAGGPI